MGIVFLYACPEKFLFSGQALSYTSQEIRIECDKEYIDEVVKLEEMDLESTYILEMQGVFYNILITSIYIKDNVVVINYCST